MNDHVPSVLRQGFSARLISGSDHAHNSALFRRGRAQFLMRRVFNPAACRFEIAVDRMTRDGVTRVKTVDFPAPHGQHLEDPRVFEHAGRLYAAYTEGDYAKAPYSAAQRLARLRDDFTVDRVFTLRHGHNFVRGAREKNWQFFSHEGAIHFVYSLDPHVVCRLADDGETVDAVHRTPGVRHWPFGTMSGGTPPVRVGDRFVSFAHGFTRHPRRHRRYSFFAYEFEAAAPFRMLRVTRPLVRASAEDPSETNPFIPSWDPLVVFPCSASLEGGEWTVCAGVNDSCDAVFTIPHRTLPFVSLDTFARPTLFYFRTRNARHPVCVPGSRRVDWHPVGVDVGGAIEGVFASSSPEVVAALEGCPGVRTITAEEYASSISL